MSMAAPSLEKLEERLKVLEDAVVPSDNEDQPTMIESLSKVFNEMSTLASSRERVKQVFKRVPEMQQYLEPGFVEKEQMDVSAQQEYLLLIEDDLKKIAAQLQRIQELQPVLNSEPIRDFRKHSSKVNQLNMKQLEQLEQTTSVSKDITVLLNQYNKLTMQLSQHFLEMDHIVTALEIKKIKEAEED